MTGGLGAGFDSSIPQSDNDIEDALRNGLLSLDANVLLSFYRFSPKARGALVEVLRAAEDRVWVSHQAAREFWRNRCHAIDGRNQATEQFEETLGKSEDSVLKALDRWAKQTAVAAEVKGQIRTAVSEAYRGVQKLTDAEAHGAGSVSYDAANDSVVTELTELLSGRVGRPLPPGEHAEAIAEGARRAKERIPPGFRDADKTETGGQDGASGDYLVWLQSIVEAVERDLPLVMVTGDEKDDWWWRHRNQFMGPRSELVDEFAERAGQRLFMLRPVQIIEHAGALDVEVSEEAVTDVARASSDQVSEWTREAVMELLRRLDAEGREQADVIRAAAENSGSIDRESIYQIAEYEPGRMLRGFTRPAARITRDLQEEGFLAIDVGPPLTPVYEGVTAMEFEIPPEMVEILSGEKT